MKISFEIECASVDELHRVMDVLKRRMFVEERTSTIIHMQNVVDVSKLPPAQQEVEKPKVVDSGGAEKAEVKGTIDGGGVVVTKAGVAPGEKITEKVLKAIEKPKEEKKPADEDDSVFLRISTIRGVITECHRRGCKDRNEILAKCVQLKKDSASPVLNMIEEKVLSDRVETVCEVLKIA